ncbi:hypothetical protein [Candidatus Nitrotoga sp. M5]|nr:hypothetical protein [Candidatus Nitrotoga sp. M5]
MKNSFKLCRDKDLRGSWNAQVWLADERVVCWQLRAVIIWS